MSRALNVTSPSGDFESSMNYKPYEFPLPINGREQTMRAKDTATTTETLLKREQFWRLYRNARTPEGSHTFTYWKRPSAGPIVV